MVAGTGRFDTEALTLFGVALFVEERRGGCVLRRASRSSASASRSSATTAPSARPETLVAAVIDALLAADGHENARVRRAARAAGDNARWR